MNKKNDKKYLIITPQKKGGVFKSGINLFIANYFIDKNIDFSIFDIDNRNATITRFQAIKPIFLDVKNNNENLDKIFNQFEESNIVVVDSGAGTTLNLIEWMNDINITELAKNINLEIIVIVPITNVKDSVAGLKDVYNVLGNDVKYIIVKNNYLGNDFDIFDNSKIKNIIIENTDHKIIELPQLNNRLLSILDKNNIIINQAIETANLNTLDKQRMISLKKIVNDFIEKMELLK